MIKQILLTAAVALVAFLVIQSRRRAAARPVETPPGRRRFSPQAIAGWVLLGVMLTAAVATALLQGA
ncbi:hypothetical protein [Spiribacter onubensis]|uniref:Uncharacterized protein n=1 Tax=Spiribacter onubensis TaxID=3122420 RepID=A0ABV3S830_9GAMM